MTAIRRVLTIRRATVKNNGIANVEAEPTALNSLTENHIDAKVTKGPHLPQIRSLADIAHSKYINVSLATLAGSGGLHSEILPLA